MNFRPFSTFTSDLDKIRCKMILLISYEFPAIDALKARFYSYL
jgi:hypothetical protein